MENNNVNNNVTDNNKEKKENKDSYTKKENIIALIDEIKNTETKDKMLKLFLAILIGSPEHTKEYIENLQDEFKNDSAVRAILISLAYIHEISKNVIDKK